MPKKLTQLVFIERSNQKHSNIYDYSLVEYVSSHLKVKIICSKHGIFEQQPYAHMNGQGCPTCSKSLSGTQRNFLKSQGCSVCHPKKYSDTIAYTKTHYTSLCKDGSNLYLFKFVKNNEFFYKIGITNNIPKRVKSFSKYYDVEVISILFQKDSAIVWDLERMFHKLFKKAKYTPSVFFHGSNECFQLNTMQLKQYFDKLKEYVNE